MQGGLWKTAASEDRVEAKNAHIRISGERPGLAPFDELRSPNNTGTMDFGRGAKLDFRRSKRPLRNYVPYFGALCLCLTIAGIALGGSAWQQNAVSQERFFSEFVAAAVERTHHVVRYDPAYVRIPYPGGDVPADTGVCTDEVIRTYRAVGVDLQREVHEDMEKHRTAYPKRWPKGKSLDARSTDTNIDHRRVPNLMVFFSRKGKVLPISANASDYRPGDLVTWNLGGGITHIGIVVDRQSAESGRYLIVHNIGRGPQMEDVLFSWKIIGHYRYAGRMREEH